MVDTLLSTYLCKAAGLLSDYQWIFNFRATHLLVNDIFSCIPPEWTHTLLGLTDEDLSLINNGIIKDGWPTCLVEFVHRCYELTLPMDPVSQSKGWNYIPAEIQKGMSPKKQHEVLHLASFIHHQCNESSLSRIIDVGSGLGYLGKFLHHYGGYQVLGLEADERYVDKAVSMQQPICSSGVKHVALTLRPAHRDEEWTMTVEEVTSAMKKHANWESGCSCGRGRETAHHPKEGSETPQMSTVAAENEWHDTCSKGTYEHSVCMVSLHSCGDLSPTALRLFLELPQVKRLVVMSCCYHKMTLVQVENRGMVEGLTDDLKTDASNSVMPKSTEMSKEGSRDRRNRSAERRKTLRSTLSGAKDGMHDGMNSDDNPHLEVTCEDKGGFPDFPMSSELERLVSARPGFLRRPLLRLASEMTVEMWRLMTAEQRNKRSVTIMGRAVFELYAKRERYKLKKMRRRGVRRSHRSNFDDYFEDALRRFEFIPNSPICTGSSGADFDGGGEVSAEVYGSDVGGRHSSEGAASLETDPTNLQRRELYDDFSEPSSHHWCNASSRGVCGGSHGFGAFPSDIPFIDDVPETAPGDSYAGESSTNGQRDPGGTFGLRRLSSELDQSMCSNTVHLPTHRDRMENDAEANASPTKIPIEVHRRKLKHLTEQKCTPEAMRLTTSLYALQAAIQSVAEGLVIADRLAFLLERGEPFIEASLVRVFDRSLSPRSLAIVARKKAHVRNDNK